MIDQLTRLVDGVEEQLCWRFTVPGRSDSIYERAKGTVGPFDPDRRRCLRRGETFQRLDRSGHPHTYRGLSWCALAAISEHRGPTKEVRA
jgi:hypothetical protein